MAKAIPSSAMISVRNSQSRKFSSRMRREECFSASFRKRSVGKGSCTFLLVLHEMQDQRHGRAEARGDEEERGEKHGRFILERRRRSSR